MCVCSVQQHKEVQDFIIPGTGQDRDEGTSPISIVFVCKITPMEKHGLIDEHPVQNSRLYG